MKTKIIKSKLDTILEKQQMSKILDDWSLDAINEVFFNIYSRFDLNLLDVSEEELEDKELALAGRFEEIFKRNIKKALKKTLLEFNENL